MSCGLPYVDFMVPDFDRLRQQPCDRNSSRSVKASPRKDFTPKIIFQQFDTKPAHLPTQADSREIDHLFFQLWLANPSWSPIILTDHGWITVKSNGQKKVPLTFNTIESYYRRDYIIGKRFGQLTNYLMIDIDINSPFHPNHNGFETILTAMERIGLVRYLIVRSSTSEGIHLYFPLPEPVNSWQLAYTAHSALTANGIHIQGGQCELFPNKKSFNAEFNGHRLPLQNGSFLLDKDFCPISNCKADFLHRWQTAATHQGEKTLQQALTGQIAFSPLDVPVAPTQPAAPLGQRKTVTATGHVIPPIVWSRFGQSNDIMCELVNYGDRYVGLKTVDDLAAWVKAVAPLLPGYQQFASPRSKRDIEHGTWPKRWAKSHFDSVWKHKNGGTDHNANVARDAKHRIFDALDRICIDASIGVTQLFNHISSMSKIWHNKTVNWRTFKKYEAEVWAYIKRPGAVGLSSRSSEAVNSSSPEPPAAEIIEAEIPEKNCYTQLLTLRCAISIYSRAFASLHTSNFGVKTQGELASAEATSTVSEGSDAEVVEVEAIESPAASLTRKGLTVGQLVRIAMPGGSYDGIEARVVAQVVDTLGQPVYRLDYQQQGRALTLPAECLQIVEAEAAVPAKDGVIRATAAQLLRVLGKACPFVGPGLWTVKREEVSPLAWRQLRQFVGEG